MVWSIDDALVLSFRSSPSSRFAYSQISIWNQVPYTHNKDKIAHPRQNGLERKRQRNGREDETLLTSPHPN